MIRNKVKLPKEIESLVNKRKMMKELLSNIDKQIDLEYLKLTDNISEIGNSKSLSMVYNGITFNIKPLKGYNDYSITKSGRRLSRLNYNSMDALKLDIVKGLV
jgi:hypothetical protein